MPVLSYHLRVQKEIERRIFLDVLSLVDRHHPIGDAVYIGLGSVYFEDFKAIHDRFGLNRMVCLEQKEWLQKRQEFNLPLSCIRLERKSVDEFLERFQRKRRCIVWLDFDGFHDVGGQLRSFDFLLRNLKAGDVAKITLDASYDKLEREAKKKMPAGKTPPPADIPRFAEQVAQKMLGKDYFPADLDAVGLLRGRNYGQILLRAAINASEKALSHEGMNFLPLTAFLYSDSSKSEMLTLTGIVLDADGGHAMETEKFPFAYGGEPYKISPLPVMTPAEKIAVDGKLPLLQNGKSADFVHKSLFERGVRFDENRGNSLKRFEKYAALYRYHPDYRKISP